MTKEVLVAIRGLQSIEKMNDTIELITNGEYYQKNNKHYILFEEVLEDQEGFTKNTLKISENQVELIKKGSYNVHFSFEEKKKNLTYYHTPFGDLLIGVRTNHILIEEDEKSIQIKIDYELEINNESISNSTIIIKITSKELN